ncbi:MAG: biopolymer transporter ExbD [Burkholderiales bacterium]|nr:biopolymer transporter ExbD [Burkholderiales bacterium]
MGMNVASMAGSTDAEPLMDVNTTPLIDVMLVLLVMLLITIPAQMHSINLFIGKGSTQPVTPQVAHVVAIDFDGTVSWDGQALASATAVDAKMREVGAVAEAVQDEVHIKPNNLVDYGAVAAVMASAQRNGAKKMAVVGHERFTS